MSPLRILPTALLLAAGLLAGSAWTAFAVDRTSYLSLELELERQLLAEDLRLWGQARQQQKDGLLEFASALAALDQAVEQREVAVQGLETLETQTQAAQEKLDGANVRATALRLQVLQRLRRTALLEIRLDALAAGGDLQLDPLSGAWALTLDPGNQTGELRLRFLNNTVTGTYRMDGGSAGSLSGTYEGGELFLERVDEAAGRDARWTGTLDPATRSIRGRWTAIAPDTSDATGTAGPSAGTWSARRQETSP